MNWINIDNRLPEENKNVQVLSEASGMNSPYEWVGFHINGKWQYCGVLPDDVTHWMPLTKSRRTK